MGPRQLGFMRRALTEVYSQDGVLLFNIEEYFNGKIKPLVERIAKLKREIRQASDEIEQTTHEQQAEDQPAARRKQICARDANELHEKKQQWRWQEKQKSLEQTAQTVESLKRRRDELLVVSSLEASWLNLVKDTSIYELLPDQQQALAVLRSAQVSVKNWLGILREFYEEVSRKGDQASRTSLVGVLLRLEQFEEGQMLHQYGPGPDAIAIENLGLLGPEDDPLGRDGRGGRRGDG